MSFKVITFNILSPNLCNPKEFMGYPEEFLDRNLRKARLLNLLSDWTSWETQPIICLQEIPFGWKNDIDRLLFTKEYRFYCMNYGNKLSGFFGIGIGVPKNFKIYKVEYLLVGDYIDHQSPEEIYCLKTSQLDEFIRNVKGVVNFIGEMPFDELRDKIIELSCKMAISLSANAKEDFIQNTMNLISDAKNRSNFTIRICLREERSSQKFFLYNYHMPCEYRRPIIQTLHLDALKYLISTHPGSPTILAGDLNLTPESVGYRFLTEGILPMDHKNYLKWRDHANLVMESSYKKVNEYEPQFTCFSTTQYGGNFCNCLDYIMTTPHFITINSDLLIETIDKIPNETCPSDHLPLCSTFTLG